MAEHVSWQDLRSDFLHKFEQGEHIAIIGPTGQGKTTVALDLLNGFWQGGGSILVLANKPKDKLLTQLQKEGWPRIKTWPPDYDHRIKRRVILWPDYGRASLAKKNVPVFTRALDMALIEGNWFVYMDEVRYFIEQLGMRQIVDEYWNGARSSKVTLVASAQGPTWINRTMVTQETWLFLFKPRHLEDMKLYSEAAGDKSIAEDLKTLGNHEFLLVHTPDGVRYISKVGS